MCLLLIDFLHLVKTSQLCIHAQVEDGILAQDELDSGLEGELVEAEVPQEGLHGEVDDVKHLLVAEDEDFVRRSLDGVVRQQVFQKFETELWFQLPFEHAMENEVQDGKHSRDLLITILVLLAEDVVHVVEV